MAQDGWEPPEPDCPGEMRIEVVEDGQITPYEGQLFTHDAAACLASQIALCVGAANAEMVRQSELCDADLEASERVRAAEMEAHVETVDVLEEALADALREPWYDSWAFKVSLGFVAGAVTGYLLSEVLR